MQHKWGVLAAELLVVGLGCAARCAPSIHAQAEELLAQRPVPCRGVPTGMSHGGCAPRWLQAEEKWARRAEDNRVTAGLRLPPPSSLTALGPASPGDPFLSII